MSSERDTGVPLKSIISFMEKFAPKNLAESWDNTGLLIEPSSKNIVNTVLLTNDLTEDVVNEALQVNSDLIISYHPPIFESLKCINSASWKGRVITTCLENKIAVYSPHTTWDSVPYGVNDWLASAFDYCNISPILQSTSGSVQNAGAGRYFQLVNEITLQQAINNIKNLTAQSHVQIALARGATLETKIKDVAVCAGSGSSVLTNHTAQLHVTGEISHHNLLDSIHNGSSVILCNHSNSERGFLKKFKVLMESEFKSHFIDIVISKADKDPLMFV